ncbi:MAG: flagellar hook-basal body complex protein [Botrimarina sp.]
MTTALTGMQASEASIDVIGNNIANSNTVGFKASEVVFATQFLQTQSIGSAPSDTNGGTNPRQIGLGVKVASISPNFNQGTIEISANPLDLAIQGDGFLLVQGGQGEELFTRNGQLNLNSQNQVVTSTGNKLLGYGVNDRYELQTARPVPIEIPLGGERVAQATSEAVFQGVLNPTVQSGTVPAEIQSEVFTNDAVERPDDAGFTSGDLAIRTAPGPGVAGVTDTGSPTGLTPGEYTYRVTFLDVNGAETSASTEFSVTAGVNDQIDLSSLPTDTSGQYAQMRIYRTEAGGSDFYRVATQPIAASTYTDTLDDATLATAPALDTGALDNGSYSYYFTYYNSANGDETRPSELFGTYAVNDNFSSIRIDLGDLAAPNDPSYNKIRIYRNASGDSSSYRLVDTVDARGQGGYVDSYIDKTRSADLSATTLDFDGRGVARAGSGTALLDVTQRDGASYVNVFEEGTLAFTGELGGSSLATQELQVTSTTTVQDLMDFIHDAVGLQTQSNVNDVPLPIGGGSVSISDGVLTVTSNYGEENAVSIPLTAFRLTPTGASVSQTVPINFSETQEPNGPGTTTEFLVYDSLGSPLTVRMTTVLEAADSNSTTYRWYASSGDSNPTPPELTTSVGNGVMVFDSRGNLVSAPSARISISREITASESPLEIDLNLSEITSLAETNSSGDAVSSLNMIRQDGFPPGVLTDFIITESGLIQGQFSNGTQRTLGQVLMARFANPQGLRQLGDGLYAPSVNSGEPFRGTPGEDGLGAITAGAVELSNTDIGQDLIEMILAQTQYQAGSRVISTAQELLDELLALQR